MKDSTERLVTEYPQPLAAAAAPPTGLARTAARLGGYALASRLLGLLRDMSMAWLAGSGPAADALAAALRLPHILRRLLGEGSLSMSLTAALVRQCRPDTAAGRVCLGQVGRALAVRLGLPLTLLTLLAVAAAPWIMAGLAPGFTQAMLAASLAKTPHAVISRAAAGVLGRSIVVNLPGSRKAVVENLAAVLPALPHALAKLRGDPADCGG